MIVVVCMLLEPLADYEITKICKSQMSFLVKPDQKLVEKCFWICYLYMPMF